MGFNWVFKGLNYHILAAISKDIALQITQLLRSGNIFIFVNPQIIQFWNAREKSCSLYKHTAFCWIWPAYHSVTCCHKMPEEHFTQAWRLLSL